MSFLAQGDVSCLRHSPSKDPEMAPCSPIPETFMVTYLYLLLALRTWCSYIVDTPTTLQKRSGYSDKTIKHADTVACQAAQPTPCTQWWINSIIMKATAVAIGVSYAQSCLAQKCHLQRSLHPSCPLRVLGGGVMGPGERRRHHHRCRGFSQADDTRQSSQDNTEKSQE